MVPPFCILRFEDFVMAQNTPLSSDRLWQLSKELLAGEPVSDTPGLSGLKNQVISLIDLLRSAMWPQIFSPETSVREPSAILVSTRLERASVLLLDMLGAVAPELSGREETVCRFFSALPSIKALLDTDVEAAYSGDPAARSTREIMLSYPSFEAVSIYRLAHCLFEMQVPLLPRMMTEHAHRLTGIDIHPGARIGSHFFIDHGTGIVIGETTTIGDHVKLYQGVTLGAKSFDLDENGNPVKGVKRHPDIGSYVVIYAGATILGGQTVIGDHCVIGGNVWLTHSVPAGETVLAAREIRES